MIKIKKSSAGTVTISSRATMSTIGNAALEGALNTFGGAIRLSKKIITLSLQNVKDKTLVKKWITCG